MLNFYESRLLKDLQWIIENNYVLTVFGVSFFEVLQYGVPAVVFSPYDGKDDDELEALSKENVAVVADSPDSAINDLVGLIKNNKAAAEYSKNALHKMSVNGSMNLSKEINKIIMEIN